MIDDFMCSCPPGASGPLCDANVDDCYPGACHNQGTCVDEVNGFRCECIPGYIGPRCEGKIFEGRIPVCNLYSVVFCINTFKLINIKHGLIKSCPIVFPSVIGVQ